MKHIIENIDTAGETVEEIDLIGSATLSDGGVYGDMLRLIRLHINDAKDNNELTESNAGEVYSNMMSAALSASIDFLFKRVESKRLDKATSLSLVRSLYDSSKIKLDIDSEQQNRKKSLFELKYILPLEREKLMETVEGMHIEHLGKTIMNNTASYNLSDILTKQSEKLTKENTLLDDEHGSKVKELDIRTYYASNMQPVEKSILSNQDGKLAFELTSLLPKESDKLSKGNTLLDDKHSSEVKELEIRTYYKDNIQVKESSKLTATIENIQSDTNLKVYEHDSIKPMDLVLLNDKHCSNIMELNIRKYYLQYGQRLESQLLEDEHLIKSKTVSEVMPVDINLKVADVNLKIADRDIKNAEIQHRLYENSYMQPLEKDLLSAEVALKVEDKVLKTLEAANRAYYNEYIQPLEMSIKNQEISLKSKEIDLKAQEILLRAKETDLKSRELDIKTYELEHLLPVQIAHEQADTARINALTNKLVQELCIVSAECAIKNYYKDNIQPLEKKLADAKSHTEEYNAGGNGSGAFVYDNSMTKQRIDQMKKQTELYDRQKWSYDEHKYQKMFDTQFNFAAMVFADTDGTDIPTAGTGSAIDGTFTNLNNAGTAP
jgi:hypothetical protein